MSLSINLDIHHSKVFSSGRLCINFDILFKNAQIKKSTIYNEKWQPEEQGLTAQVFVR